MKNLLIGGVDLYDWSQVSTWVRSIRETGFNDDIVILSYRLKNQEYFIEQCEKENVQVFQIDFDQFGQKINHNDRGRDTQSHQLRFFHMWQYLKQFSDNHYDYVLTTDVRDVFFQKNPFDFLSEFDSHKILASSEGIKYGDESWGMNNMVNGFGPIVSQYAKDWEIYNVGVMAGPKKEMENMFFKIYNMTVGRYIPSDQSAYNILVNMTDTDSFIKMNHDLTWACQCGTTADPEKSHYLNNLVCLPPKIIENKVLNSSGEEYHIVHQWDRVPSLQKLRR